MKRLSNSEIKDLNKQLQEQYTIENFISKKDKVEQDENIIFMNEKKTFFSYENKLIPTLQTLMQSSNFNFKKITVDMGAVKFVVSGADVMRPGIVEIETEIKRNDIVQIIDINNKKTLALGIALFSSDELTLMKTGKVIKNVHYVGDKFWV